MPSVQSHIILSFQKKKIFVNCHFHGISTVMYLQCTQYFYVYLRNHCSLSCTLQKTTEIDMQRDKFPAWQNRRCWKVRVCKRRIFRIPNVSSYTVLAPRGAVLSWQQKECIDKCSLYFVLVKHPHLSRCLHTGKGSRLIWKPSKGRTLGVSLLSWQ